MGIKMKGWDKARTSFHTLKDEYSSYVNDAVREHTDEVFQETQTRVPRETGALAGTGLIEPISTAGEKISYKIWYGEPGEGPYTIDYAAAVHEILKAKHVPPTGAKYVEQPLIESVPNAKARIARKMGEAVRGAFQ